MTASIRTFLGSKLDPRGGLFGGSIFGLKNVLKNDCF